MFASNKCPECNGCFQKLSKHIVAAHPEYAKVQDDLVLKYYREGLSAKKIAVLPDIMYAGSASIVRLLNKHYTKEQLETGRRDRIGKTLEVEYATGNLDWIKDINTERNKTDEARQKNSEGLYKAYADGIREPTIWYNSLTEDEKVSFRKSQSAKMKELFTDGQLTTLFQSGENHPNWKEDRSQVSNEYRKNQEFQRQDRVAILDRAGHKCEGCGITAAELETMKTQDNLPRCMLECDHITPIKEGGKRDWESNGQALCSACHMIKTLEEYHRNHSAA